MTCVSVCVLGLAMAMTPLTQAFVAPGSGFSAVHGRDVASSACSKVSLRGRNAVYTKSVSRATYKCQQVRYRTPFLCAVFLFGPFFHVPFKYDLILEVASYKQMWVQTADGIMYWQPKATGTLVAVFMCKLLLL